MAVSEYQRSFPNQIRQWINGKYIVLGTDGFGRSDSREALRDFFEIDHHHIILASLRALDKEKDFKEYVSKNKIEIKEISPWET